MGKQSFDRVRKTLCILLAILLLVSLTAASASAWYNKKGEVIGPPEKAKEEKKEKSVPAPEIAAPEIAPVPSALGCPGGFGECDRFGECNRFGECDRFGCCDRFGRCGRCGDENKIAAITAVRVAVAKGEGCFDKVLW